MSDEKQEGATPGPWVLDPGVVMGSRRVKAGGRLVAEVSAWGHGDVDQAAANARLISAAPDMLEALKLFEMKEERLLSAQGEYLTVRIPVSAFQARAAAIDKATLPTIGAAVKKG